MSERLTPISAAALFWWARNQLYFDQQLWNDDRIKIVNYEAALNRPVEMVDALSSYLGVGLPSQAIAAKIRPYNDRVPLHLHPKVEYLCAEMWSSFAGCPEVLVCHPARLAVRSPQVDAPFGGVRSGSSTTDFDPVLYERVGDPHAELLADGTMAVNG